MLFAYKQLQHISPCSCCSAHVDELPEDLLASGLDLHMAQHLLAAAEMYQLGRLRRICEQALVDSVDLDNAATTLALAEQNHAEVRMIRRNTNWQQWLAAC